MPLTQPIKVISRTSHHRGSLIKVATGGRTVAILFTTHAIARLKEWKISEGLVLETLLYPSEVLKGHRGRFIAHTVRGQRVLRVVYEYDKKIPAIITLYNPFAKRYFQGGGSYEDQILS